jgi:hypothetical protein
MIQIPKELFVLLLIFGCYFAGWSTVTWMIDNNQHRDYHCQPITKHNTLEDAKAQVERYQAMVRG